MFHYLKPYASFSSVQQMDEHVDKHIQFHDLTKSEQAILRAISQHALATPGAAHLKAKTIAEKLQISTKTVYRAVKKFESFAIVKKLSQTKMNGIKGANIYVICPYVPSKMSERIDAEKPVASSVPDRSSNVQSLDFKSSFCSNKYNISEPNEWHKKLLLLFSDYPINASLVAGMEEAIIQLPIENAKQYDRAKRIIQELLVRIQTGALTIQTSFKALVAGAYEKWILPEPKVFTPTIARTRPVPFYNWLEIRGEI